MPELSVSMALTDEAIAADRNAKAISFLTRTGNADLLPILGLVADDVDPGRCVSCGNVLRLDHRAASRYCLRVACKKAKADAQAQDTAGAR